MKNVRQAAMLNIIRSAIAPRQISENCAARHFCDQATIWTSELGPIK